MLNCFDNKKIMNFIQFFLFFTEMYYELWNIVSYIIFYIKRENYYFIYCFLYNFLYKKRELLFHILFD